MSNFNIRTQEQSLQNMITSSTRIDNIFKIPNNNQPLLFGDTIKYDGENWDFFSETLFLLSENTYINQAEKYIIFDNYGTKDFIVAENFFMYTGINKRKIFFDIQLLYKWSESDVPPRFRLELYVKKNKTNLIELIFQQLIGLNDFININGLLSSSVIIDLENNDKIYIKIIKNNENILILKQNSNIKLKYIR
jgi:hypothetical protein